MKHREYLDTAKRHLAACQMFFNNTQWEITPKKSDLLKEKVLLLKSKEDYIEKKTAFLKEWISLLREQISSIDKYREWLQEVNASSQEEIELLVNTSRQLQNATTSLIKQNDLLKEINNPSCQQVSFLNGITRSLNDDLNWQGKQKRQIKEDNIFLEKLSSKLKDSVHQLESIADLINQEFPQRLYSEFLEQGTLQQLEDVHQLEELSDRLENQEKTLISNLRLCNSNLEAIFQELKDDISKLEGIDEFSKDINKTFNEQKSHLEEIIDKLKKQLNKTDNTIECITWLEEQGALLRKNKAFLKQYDAYTRKDVYQSKEYKAWLKNRKEISHLETERNEDDVLLKKKFDHFNEEVEKKNYLLKDIYYLTGYILEALTIYAAYEGGRFKGNRITDLDIDFTQKTHIDFYKVNFNLSTKCWYSNRQNPKRNDEKYCNKDVFKQDEYENDLKALKELNKLIDEWKQKEFKEKKRDTYFHSVENHHFYEIITNVLNDSTIENTLITNDVPYLSSIENIPIENGALIKKVEILIQNWDTSLRYTEKESEKWICIENEKALQQETLEQLIKLCETIFAAINHA